MLRLRLLPLAFVHWRWQLLGWLHRTALHLRSQADRSLGHLAQRFPAWNPLIARGRAWLGEFSRPRSLGERGERLAEQYLKRLGYQIVDRRVRGPLGELDLIAVQDRTLVFVEVKTRRSHAKGSPLEAVGEQKQRRLVRLALSWLKRHHLLCHPARFDVVGITWPRDQDRPRIRHIRNAFSPAGRWQFFS